MDWKETFSAFIHNLQEVETITNIRKEAFEAFLKAELPNPGMESWRKINLSQFQVDSYLLESRNVKAPTISSGDSGRLRDANQLEGDDLNSFAGILEDSVRHFHGEYFPLLNLAFFTNGLYLETPKESISEKGWQIDFTLSEESGICIPLLCVKAGSFSKVSVLERNTTNPEISGLFNGLTLMNLGESSQVDYVRIQEFGAKTYGFHTVWSRQSRDSGLHATAADLSSYRTKDYWDLEVDGKGSRTRLLGISSLEKTEFQDTEAKISHLEGQSESSILYRATVQDRAHHVFTGDLVIPHSSQAVNAVQINNNLILNKTARAESIPKLEVMADNVKCEHGATVGEIDPEQIFYLISRGLTEREAKKMIVDGFLTEVLNEIPIEAAREEIRERIDNKVRA